MADDLAPQPVPTTVDQLVKQAKRARKVSVPAALAATPLSQPVVTAPVEPSPIDPMPVAVPDAAPQAAAVPVDIAPIIEAAPSPAVESDASSEAAPAAPISEGIEEMATIANPADATYAATDKAQAAFGDMSARMKTAFEKSTKIGEELVDFAKGNVEALVASARVAATAGQSLGQDAADYGKKSFESATTAFKSFATVKSPTELFQLQSEFAKSSFDSAVAEASRVSEAMLKVAGEIAQPLSNRYAVAAEKFKAPTL